MAILYCSLQGSALDGMDKYPGGMSGEPGTGVQTSYSSQPGSGYSGCPQTIYSDQPGNCYSHHSTVVWAL